jgi:hypothetical protein
MAVTARIDVNTGTFSDKITCQFHLIRQQQSLSLPPPFCKVHMDREDRKKTDLGFIIGIAKMLANQCYLKTYISSKRLHDVDCFTTTSKQVPAGGENTTVTFYFLEHK